MAEIYVLLTRTNTLFSRIVHFATRSEYTHASISMRPDCTELYSFARKHTRLPLPAGFVQENVNTGMLRRCENAPFALYRATVSKQVYDRLSERFTQMLAEDRMKYSLSGTLYCFFHIRRKKKDRYFCSQFVAEVLQEMGVIKEVKHSSLYKPCDFEDAKELTLCCTGVLGELQRRELCG